jgi:hypothetical protein
MATDIGNLLHSEGIISVLMLGNLDMDNETLAQCNHVWLKVCNRESIQGVLSCYYIEPTTGEIFGIGVPKQYTEGYLSSSPSTFQTNTKGTLP